MRQGDIWALTLPVVVVGLAVLTAVMVSLCGAVVRLAKGPGLAVRTAGPRPAGWTVETFGIGYQTPAGVEWWQVRMTWPEAAEWAASTSRRRDVSRAFVDVPSTSSTGVTSWLWESGIQTRRTEVSYV
ncbi:hypothetical protein [Microtetraspora malaysiensis]|uniref:hypothetical protein n=1 Tax=Microtetraspora malaysiensis TaxID=161358 RepID=UPI003D8C7CA3